MIQQKVAYKSKAVCLYQARSGKPPFLLHSPNTLVIVSIPPVLIAKKSRYGLRVVTQNHPV
jgi:hypothetical protein